MTRSYRTSALVFSVIMFTGSISAKQQFIVHEAATLNALHAAVNPTSGDQKGWPIPEGWQDGGYLTEMPTGIGFWDTTIFVGSDERREYWVTSISFQQCRGTLPSSLSYPRLRYVQFNGDSTFGGSLTQVSCPQLRSLQLIGGKITGSIPIVAHPMIESISISSTAMSGVVPTLNCPALKDLYLVRNAFTTIQPQNLPELRELSLWGGYGDETTFSGPFPTITAPKLVDLYAQDCQFTGPVPDVTQWPFLEEFSISNNKFSGPLPATITHSALQSYQLSGNPIGGALPMLVMPKLKMLGMTNCGFTGTLPAWNLPLLQSLSVAQNKLKHPLPTMSVPAMTYFDIGGNQFEDLPVLKNVFPALTMAQVWGNKLTFEDLEKNMNLAPSFYYRDQDSIQRYREVRGTNVIYRVKVGGTANKYQWYWYGAMSGQTADSLVVKLADDDSIYRCQVTNTLVPNLTLYTRRGEAPVSKNPIIVGGLEFYAESGEWEPDEENPVYSASGAISINDFLRFDGTMSVDTEAVSIEATGVFSLKDVPLPGGGSGTFILCEGTYGLKILGEDGVITDFANDILSKLPDFAGITVELSNIKLLGGRDANGISISGSIEIEGMANGCASNEPGPTKIEIEDLAYTKADGPSLGGMKIEDLGFVSFPKFCVKSLEAKYEKDKDKLSFGASVKMPYAEVGGGIAMILDKVDSIAWRIEATEAAVPLGQSNLGMSGFFGSISGIQSTPLDVELGGVFVTMVPKDFVKFDASGTYTAPATLGLKIDGMAIPTPMEDDQYQLKLKGSTKYDFAEGMAKVEGEAHVGTTDGEEYFIDGSLKFDLKASSLAIKGEVSGGYQITAFGEEDADEYPYDWINAKLGLPKKVTTEAVFAFIKSRVLYGVAHLGPDMGDLNYVFDFRKSWRDPDFLYWNRTPAAEEMPVAGDVMTTRTVIVPANATRMVVRVKGASALPATTLTMPNGTVITGDDAAKRIDYTVANGTTKAFWTLLTPVQGRWMIDAPTLSTGDVIEIFVDAPIDPLVITTTQNSRNVTVNWTPQGGPTDSVAFFVAGTFSTADGIDLGKAAMNAGVATFTVPMDLPVCQFMVEAQGTSGTSVVSDTATTPVIVQTGSVTPPSMMVAQYYTGQRRLNIAWKPGAVSDQATKSYIIYARSGNGEERVIGEAFRWVGWVSIAYTRQTGDRILVRGVDANGRMGCPAEITNITTDIIETPEDSLVDSHDLVVIPHPVTQQANVHFWSTLGGAAVIELTDLQGRLVSTIYNGTVDSGANVVAFDASGMPAGVYALTFRMHDEHQRLLVMISR